jgi:hypothetical protein
MMYAMTRDEREREVDLALAGSFPASDPPPWTFGAAPVELAPSPRPRTPDAPAAVDVVIAGGRRRRRAAAMAEAMAMTALVPAGVLMVAAPFLIIVWGVSAAAAWLFGGR